MHYFGCSHTVVLYDQSPKFPVSLVPGHGLSMVALAHYSIAVAPLVVTRGLALHSHIQFASLASILMDAGRLRLGL